MDLLYQMIVFIFLAINPSKNTHAEYQHLCQNTTEEYFVLLLRHALEIHDVT